MKVYLKLLILAMLALAVVSCGSSGGAKELKANDGVVVVPVKDVNDGKAHFYYTKIDGKEIKYFFLKSDDGVIRAAFDACDVCFREKKGYTQKGDFMVCNNCGMQFHSRRINEVSGGCNPSPLDRTIDQTMVSIKVDDIAAGAMYF